MADPALSGNRGSVGPTNPLPHAERALILPQKLSGYALNQAHPRGGSKARVFERVLGFTAERWQELRDAILAALPDAPAVLSQRSAYGDHYRVDLVLRGPAGRSATVRTAWIILAGETVPRLTSAYVRRSDGARLGTREAD